MKSFIKKCFTINREMLIVKLLYLSFGGIVGTHAPYLHVFLRSIGFSAKQSGFLAGIRFVVSSFANPLWGYFADRTGHRKLTLAILLLGAAICVVPMPFVAYGLRDTYNTTEINSTRNISSAIEYLGVETPQVPFNATLYYVLMVMAVISALFIIPLPGYLDTIGANAARNSVSKASYGAQRIFGSVGSSLSQFITGVASDHYHYSGMSSYTPAFYFLLLYLGLTLPVGIRLINQGNYASEDPADGTNVEKKKPPPNARKLLWRMLKNPDAIFFYATLIVSGLCFNISIYFVLLLIENEHCFHSTKAQNSFALVLASISNMAIFPLSGMIIRLLRGPTQAMMLAFATYIFRYMIMSYTTVFWIMIAVQASNGLTFALMWASAMEHVHKIAPKEIILTVFMLNSMVHFGICGLISNTLGGWIFDRYGGRALFRGAALMSVGWLTVMIVYTVFRYFRKQRSEEVFPDDLGKVNIASITNESRTSSNGVSNGCLKSDVKSQTVVPDVADIVSSHPVRGGKEEGFDNAAMEMKEPS